MPIVEDSASGTLVSVDIQNADPTNQTPSFTNVAGTLLVLVVGLGCASGQSTSLSSVTYGGQAMTLLTEKTVTNGGTDSRIQIWYLLNPPTGSNAFAFDPTITFGATNWANVWAGAKSFRGHDPVTPFTSNIGVASSNGVANTAISVSTPSPVAVANYIVGAVGGGFGSWTGNMTPAQWFSFATSHTQLGSGRAGVQGGTGSVVTVSGVQSGADSWVAIVAEIAVGPPDPNPINPAHSRFGPF